MGLAGALGDREAFGRDAANTPDLELGQQTKNGRGRGRVLEGAVGEKKKKKKIKKIMATIRCWWTCGLYLALICFALFSSFFFFIIIIIFAFVFACFRTWSCYCFELWSRYFTFFSRLYFFCSFPLIKRETALSM